MPMRIALDIDGCMTDDNRFRLEQYGKYLYEKNMPYMDLPYESEYIEQVEPIRYVSEVTHKLHEDGDYIVIATGRHGTTQKDPFGEKVRNITKEWLKKHDIYYDEILFSGFPKVDYIRPYKCDVFVEDYSMTIKSLAKEMPVLIFDNPYNRFLECQNTIRVFSWYDIYRRVKEMEK